MENKPINSFPPDFLDAINAQLGCQSSLLLTALQSDTNTSIRVNKSKKNTHFEHTKQVPWCKEGFYLPQRPIFTNDPLFHAGCYYVQEASSMFLAHIFETLQLHTNKINVLDLCAAPGGKSTLILDNIHEQSLVVSNEVIKTRANILRQNITKWGKANVAITNNDPADFKKIPNFFDVIVVDAPCSGEGMFRKDKNARHEWSLQNVDLCAARQKRILHDVIDALKPGGTIIYTTCTFNEKENIKNVHYFEAELGLETQNIEINLNWGIQQIAKGCFQFFPHLLMGEGFFCAVLQKKNSDEQNKYTPKIKNKYDFVSKPNIEILKNWITPDGLDFMQINQNIHALPLANLQDISLIMNKLYCIHAGILVGELKNNALIPSHDLAISSLLLPQIPKLNLSLVQALDYLKKNDNAQDLPLENVPKGWFLNTFDGINLGFSKKIDSRINNYYPKEWRILKNL